MISCPYSHTGHALIVMPSPVLLAHAMGIADEQRAHAVLLAEGDDLACPFVAQVPDLAAFARAHLAPSGPQLARPP